MLRFGPNDVLKNTQNDPLRIVRRGLEGTEQEQRQLPKLKRIVYRLIGISSVIGLVFVALVGLFSSGHRFGYEEVIDSRQRALINRFGVEVARAFGRELSKAEYPIVARTNHWQGAAKLHFRFVAGGKLENVTIYISSGYSALDERAIEVAKRITVPEVPPDLRRMSFTVTLPVTFVLPGVKT